MFQWLHLGASEPLATTEYNVATLRGDGTSLEGYIIEIESEHFKIES
jgi:hypothetical protein